jgi:hypothetical protein
VQRHQQHLRKKRGYYVSAKGALKDLLRQEASRAGMREARASTIVESVYRQYQRAKGADFPGPGEDLQLVLAFLRLILTHGPGYWRGPRIRAREGVFSD